MHIVSKKGKTFIIMKYILKYDINWKVLLLRGANEALGAFDVNSDIKGLVF